MLTKIFGILGVFLGFCVFIDAITGDRLFLSRLIRFNTPKGPLETTLWHKTKIALGGLVIMAAAYLSSLY